MRAARKVLEDAKVVVQAALLATIVLGAAETDEVIQGHFRRGSLIIVGDGRAGEHHGRGHSGAEVLQFLAEPILHIGCDD
jgi:hypothetical protein